MGPILFIIVYHGICSENLMVLTSPQWTINLIGLSDLLSLSIFPHISSIYQLSIIKVLLITPLQSHPLQANNMIYTQNSK